VVVDRVHVLDPESPFHVVYYPDCQRVVLLVLKPDRGSGDEKFLLLIPYSPTKSISMKKGVKISYSNGIFRKF
jgi:hypothetical protein